MRVADRIAEWLGERGITHAFGIIGGGNVTLFNAIAKAKKTQIVCCHHEQAAAMASTYFNRTRGNLSSVVLVTTGAGSSNALTGVLAAHMDGVPLLVISGNEASKYMDAKTRILGVQGYRSAYMASTGAAKFSSTLGNPCNAVRLINEGYNQAIRPRSGVAWCDLPKDIANAMV